MTYCAQYSVCISHSHLQVVPEDWEAGSRRIEMREVDRKIWIQTVFKAPTNWYVG